MYLESVNKKEFIFHQSDKKMGIVLSIFLLILNLYSYFVNDSISKILLFLFLLNIFLFLFIPVVFKPLNKIFSSLILFLAEYISKFLMFVLYFVVLYPLSLLSKISLFSKSKYKQSNWEKSQKNNINFDNQY